MIQKGVERDLYAVALKPAERDAILSVLEDPPDGLVELRGVLARDHADRTQGLSGVYAAGSRPADVRGFGRTGSGAWSRGLFAWLRHESKPLVVIFAINCGIVATFRRPFAVSCRLVAL
jgi:hypothetical protein